MRNAMQERRRKTTSGPPSGLTPMSLKVEDKSFFPPPHPFSCSPQAPAGRKCRTMRKGVRLLSFPWTVRGKGEGVGGAGGEGETFGALYGSPSPSALHLHLKESADLYSNSISVGPSTWYAGRSPPGDWRLSEAKSRPVGSGGSSLLLHCSTVPLSRAAHDNPSHRSASSSWRGGDSRGRRQLGSTGRSNRFGAGRSGSKYLFPETAVCGRSNKSRASATVQLIIWLLPRR
jgi:hypothetical protein